MESFYFCATTTTFCALYTQPSSTGAESSLSTVSTEEVGNAVSPVSTEKVGNAASSVKAIVECGGDANAEGECVGLGTGTAANLLLLALVEVSTVYGSVEEALEGAADQSSGNQAMCFPFTSWF